MNKNKLLILLLMSIASLLIISSTASALSFSQSYKQDYVKVKDKWIYREDLSGQHRGFTLAHKFVLPREEIQINYNDKPATTTNINTQAAASIAIGSGFGSGVIGTSWSSGVGRSSLGSLGGGSVGSYSSTNNRAVSDAFDTYQQNTRPSYRYGGYGYGSGYGSGYGNYYGGWGSGAVRIGW